MLNKSQALLDDPEVIKCASSFLCLLQVSGYSSQDACKVLDVHRHLFSFFVSGLKSCLILGCSPTKR